MFGILIAAVVAAWSLIFGQGNSAQAFLAGSEVLWIWYLIWAILVGAAVSVLVLGLLTGLVAAGSALASSLGGLLGLAGGTALSLWVFLPLALRHLLRLGGAYLLLTALPPQTLSFASADTGQLVIGGIMVILGVILFRRPKTRTVRVQANRPG